MVAADDDDLGGFPTDFTARHVDGALLVVGYVDEHFQGTLRARGVEDRLFEDLASVFGHGDERKFGWNAAAVGR